MNRIRNGNGWVRTRLLTLTHILVAAGNKANKLKQNIAGLLVFTIIGCGNGQAQETTGNSSSINFSALVDPNGVVALSGTNMPSLKTWSDEQLAALVMALDATPTIPLATLPRDGMVGTYWSLQNPSFPPLPGDTIGANVWPMEDGSFLLNDVNYDYNAPAAQPPVSKVAATSFKTRVVIAKDGPGIPGDGGTNTYNPNDVTNTPPDYGTNLWIASPYVAAGYLNAIGTNTLWVEYEVQSRTNLAQSDWHSEGFFYGSDSTNSTPFSVAQNGRTNLFIRLKSYGSSDGSSLPLWWEQQYGLTNADPAAQDAAGDGYTIYQKYVLGVNPNAWFTPVAPQGLTAVYNANNDSTLLSWLPSLGPLVGYTVQKADYSGNTVNYTLSASTTSMTDNDTLNGSFATETFSVEANYTNGNSAWASVDIYNVAFPVFTVINGAQGWLTLIFNDLPKDLSAVRVYRTSNDTGGLWPAIGEGSGYPTDLPDGYFDIPATSITNGIVPIPASEIYSFGEYDFAAQFMESNGVGSGVGYASTSDNNVFLDGRAQLKDNLRFKLRAASDNAQFELYPALEPTNYVYVGFGLGSWPLQPFADNNYFRNLLFNANNLVTNPGGGQGVGMPNTGAEFIGHYDDMDGAYYADNDLQVVNPQYPNDDGFPSFITTNYPVAGPGSWLSVSQSQWFLQISDALLDGLPANYQNYWGLAYSSQLDVNYTNNQFVLVNQSPGSSPLSEPGMGMTYYNLNQPVFQTDSYYFARPGIDPLPEQNVGDVSQNNSRQNIFSVTNTTPSFMFVAEGDSLQVAGYAKLAVQNGNPGVYGYLGQYFDQAYTASNGVATGTNSGILSPYGNFFATQPGQAALVTMPDIDTGERGTCIVHCVSIELDKNHDGVMDETFNGPDWTTQANPMEVWVNNGHDEPGKNGNLDQDWPVPPSSTDYTSGMVTCPRDLENFFRLWIRGVPQWINIEGYSATLSMTALSGNPAINIYAATDADGGTGYLSDTNAAAQQTFETLNGSLTSEHVTADGTVSAQQSYNIPLGSSYITRFLFEGAGIGLGQLTLTISQNSNVVCQASAYLDLHDIKDFYERAVITNNYSANAISNWTSAVETVMNPQTTNSSDKDLIVFVHGINVPYWNWLDASDTVFKRLYWAGYQGKFATVKWPCTMGIQLIEFNSSELYAYKASFGLTNYLRQIRSRFPGYRLNILAHSQGNAIVGEAIKEGASFDSYILTQGALPASAYDVNALLYPALTNQQAYVPTPEWQPMGYHGIYTNFTGRIVNFYNYYDPVLDVWLADQIELKPNEYAFNGGNYSYDGTNSWHLIEGAPALLVTDPQESRAMVSRSLTLPIGQSGPQTPHGVINSGVDLNADYGFYKAFPDDHSAQWTWPIQRTLPYYQQILLEIQPAQ